MSKVLSDELSCLRTGPKVIKVFSCLTELSMKIFLLINVKMPTVVGISTAYQAYLNMKKADFLYSFILTSI